MTELVFKSWLWCYNIFIICYKRHSLIGLGLTEQWYIVWFRYIYSSAFPFYLRNYQTVKVRKFILIIFWRRKKSSLCRYSIFPLHTHEYLIFTFKMFRYYLNFIHIFLICDFSRLVHRLCVWSLKLLVLQKHLSIIEPFLIFTQKIKILNSSSERS